MFQGKDFLSRHPWSRIMIIHFPPRTQRIFTSSGMLFGLLSAPPVLVMILEVETSLFSSKESRVRDGQDVQCFVLKHLPRDTLTTWCLRNSYYSFFCYPCYHLILIIITIPITITIIGVIIIIPVSCRLFLFASFYFSFLFFEASARSVTSESKPFKSEVLKNSKGDFCWWILYQLSCFLQGFDVKLLCCCTPVLWRLCYLFMYMFENINMLLTPAAEQQTIDYSFDVLVITAIPNDQIVIGANAIIIITIEIIVAMSLISIKIIISVIFIVIILVFILITIILLNYS